MYGLAVMSYQYGAPAIAKLGWQTAFRNKTIKLYIATIVIRL